MEDPLLVLLGAVAVVRTHKNNHSPPHSTHSIWPFSELKLRIQLETATKDCAEESVPNSRDAKYGSLGQSEDEIENCGVGYAGVSDVGTFIITSFYTRRLIRHGSTFDCQLDCEHMECS